MLELAGSPDATSGLGSTDTLAVIQSVDSSRSPFLKPAHLPEHNNLQRVVLQFPPSPQQPQHSQHQEQVQLHAPSSPSLPSSTTVGPPHGTVDSLCDSSCEAGADMQADLDMQAQGEWDYYYFPPPLTVQQEELPQCVQISYAELTQDTASIPLGEGSYGKVITGRWKHQEVAIKFLGSSTNTSTNSTNASNMGAAGSLSQNTPTSADLEREVKMQARCSHPHVVQIKAWCQSPPLIIMERCCCSLGDALKAFRCNARNPVPPQPPPDLWHPGLAANGNGNQAAAQQIHMLDSWAGCQGSTETERQQQQQQHAAQRAQQLQAKQVSAILSSLSRRLELLLQGAEAMLHMHSLQPAVLHNDLRADNMLLDLDERQGTLHLKVADFGLAVEEANQGSRNTGAAAAVAAPTNAPNALWSAPELSKAEKEWLQCLSTASDVHSFGGVMYEMVTGLAPLAQSSAQAVDLLSVQVAVRKGEVLGPWETPGFPRPEVLLPCASGGSPQEVLEPLLQQCWSVAPEHRPTAAVLRDGIRQALEQRRAEQQHLQQHQQQHQHHTTQPVCG